MTTLEAVTDSPPAKLPNGEPNRKLKTKEAAEMLGIKPGTLADWRRAKTVGPKFVQPGSDGKSVFYWESDILEYLAERRSGPMDIDAIAGTSAKPAA